LYQVARWFNSFTEINFPGKAKLGQGKIKEVEEVVGYSEQLSLTMRVGFFKARMSADFQASSEPYHLVLKYIFLINEERMMCPYSPLFKVKLALLSRFVQ
jgi:hypothetical protein